MVSDRLAAEPRLLLDPNTLSPDGTVALTGSAVSDDGKLLAYSLSRSGADWQEWHIRDVDTAKDRADVVKWSKFSGASWAKDGSGFFYSRFDEPKAGDERKGVVEFHKLYFHKLSTPQSDDRLVYERKDQKEWGFHAEVTEDGRFLIIAVTRGTDPRNAVFYQDLKKPVHQLWNCSGVSMRTTVSSETKGRLSSSRLTCRRRAGESSQWTWKRRVPIPNRSNPRLEKNYLSFRRRRRSGVSASSSKANSTRWHEIIAESAETLESTSLVGGKLICTYLQDAHNVVRVFGIPASGSLAKQIREVPLPSLGSVEGFGGSTMTRKPSTTLIASRVRGQFIVSTSRPTRAPSIARRR
jgi:prolyl oligopeptidase